jgi:excinuclease ABC subunit C
LQSDKEQSLLNLVDRFPENPGVYIMKDTSGTPIYIGKAINLRNRVRSYFFDSHDERAQIPIMLQKLDHIDWIATNTETEALILEANLIRTHKPKYNIDLRDDKHYPYLKITLGEPFPRLLIVRRVEKDNAKYFGPYTDVRAMRKLVTYAKSIFKLRDCNRQLPLAKPDRPCLNFSMKICSGACAEKITQDEYRMNVFNLLRFLSGKRNDLVNELQAMMTKASDEYRFEKAAEYRDQINLIKEASRLQQVDLKLTDLNCDVFGLAQGDRSICLSVMHFVDGLLISTRHYIFKRQTWDFTKSNHDSLFLQYYSSEDNEPPEEILLPDNTDFNVNILQNWLNQNFSVKRQLLVPQKGTRKHLILMAEKNAQLYLLQRNPPNSTEDISDLQKVLKLPVLPEIIEAFDISNLGESFAVAGMVQFKDGLPNKSQYRKFKIKYAEGQNDFAMMMEVVTRRLRRLRDEQLPFPDLLLIDGGLGQLNAAREALKLFENPPLIASLAKKEEILYSPCLADPVKLPQSHPARRLVERIRDEVHRYAISFHRKIRGKQFKTSILENIDGIGKKRATTLLKQFGSVQRLKNATFEELREATKLSEEKTYKLMDILKSIG